MPPARCFNDYRFIEKRIIRSFTKLVNSRLHLWYSLEYLLNLFYHHKYPLKSVYNR